jgi:hypothetical protein
VAGYRDWLAQLIAGLGYALQPSSNVDAIAEDVVVVDDDVADMDADAELDHLILRHGGILLGHTALDFNRAAHGINGAGKLNQHTVTGRLDDAAAMGGYGGVNEGLSDSLFGTHSRHFAIKQNGNDSDKC